jgi:hypothetical protein
MRPFPAVRPNNKPHVTFQVYVPREGVDTTIASGSGIVGRPNAEDPRIIVMDYEGNLYGAENLREYGQRVMHAADRSVTHYPTVARRALSLERVAEAFVLIGTYDYHEDRLDVTDAEAQGQLDRWLSAAGAR